MNNFDNSLNKIDIGFKRLNKKVNIIFILGIINFILRIICYDIFLW